MLICQSCKASPLREQRRVLSSHARRRRPWKRGSPDFGGASNFHLAPHLGLPILSGLLGTISCFPKFRLVGHQSPRLRLRLPQTLLTANSWEPGGSGNLASWRQPVLGGAGQASSVTTCLCGAPPSRTVGIPVQPVQVTLVHKRVILPFGPFYLARRLEGHPSFPPPAQPCSALPLCLQPQIPGAGVAAQCGSLCFTCS